MEEKRQGGDYSPLAAPGADASSASQDKWSAFTAGVANFNIQYNFQVIAIALVFMDNSDPDSGGTSGGSGGAQNVTEVAFPRTEAQSSTMASSVFAGAVVGQCVMGYLGDLIGRKWALVATNMFVFVGAIASALFPFRSDNHGLALDDSYYTSVYTWIAVSRFVLGIGVGGKYPLSAVARHEGSDSSKNPAAEVSKAFFWQTPGVIAPFVIASILDAVDGEGMRSFSAVGHEVRILMGLGALPAAVVLLTAVFKQQDSQAFQDARLANPLATALKDRSQWRKLAGAGLSWAVYDFMFYGMTMFQPEVLNNIFGKAESLMDNCWQNIVVASIGLPAVLLAIWNLGQIGLKPLQSWGFLVCSICSLILGLVRYVTDAHVPAFIAYLALIFALNWAINITTFVLPAQCFPAEVRSTYNGLASAMAKLGALLGTYCFKPMKNAVGFPGTYMICAGISLVGIVITHFCVEPYGNGTWKQEEAPEEEEEAWLAEPVE